MALEMEMSTLHMHLWSIAHSLPGKKPGKNLGRDAGLTLTLSCQLIVNWLENMATATHNTQKMNALVIRHLPSDK